MVMASWPETVSSPSLQESLITASGGLGLVFQLILHDQVTFPSASAVFGDRSFEVEIVPDGSVTSMAHWAFGAVLI